MASAKNPRDKHWPAGAARGPSLAINYASTDQSLPTIARGLHINVSGTLVLVLDGDTHGGLAYNVVAGGWYPYAVKTIVKTGSSGAAGNILL